MYNVITLFHCLFGAGCQALYNQQNVVQPVFMPIVSKPQVTAPHHAKDHASASVHKEGHAPHYHNVTFSSLPAMGREGRVRRKSRPFAFINPQAHAALPGTLLLHPDMSRRADGQKHTISVVNLQLACLHPSMKALPVLPPIHTGQQPVSLSSQSIATHDHYGLNGVHVVVTRK